jgi:glutamate synthase (NADPH) small chain
VDFLTDAVKHVFSGCKAPLSISAHDKDVVVIGGGDTGTDCVAASVRQGCRSVVQLEVMPRPPLCRQEDNPWPQWPKLWKTDYGQEEAALLYGMDPRIYLVKPSRIIGGCGGEVKAVVISDVVWTADEKGIRYPKEAEGTKREYKAQLVLLAMGFTGTEQYIFDSFPVRRSSKNNIMTEPGSFKTDGTGIFAAGDARRGQSLVVWAMHEGRKAAAEVNEYLKGR